MGDGEKAPLRLQFNPKIRLEFHGSTITSDAGLLAFREFDDALGLTEIAEDYLQDRRTGRNILPPPGSSATPVYLQSPGWLGRHQRCRPFSLRPRHASSRGMAGLGTQGCQHQRDGAV